MNQEILVQLVSHLKESPYLISVTIICVSLMIIFKKNLVLLTQTLLQLFFKGRAALTKKQYIFILKNHDVFNALIRAGNEVNMMKFYTHGEFDRVKTKMCSDFTRHKAFHCRFHMLKIVETEGIDILHKDALRALITDSQNQMHIDYIKSIRLDWLNRGIPTEDVDNVVHMFEKFRYDVVNSFDHRITSVFGSGFHRSNFDIVLAIYDMWAMGVDLLPKDMQTTFEGLNGKFKDIKY